MEMNVEVSASTVKSFHLSSNGASTRIRWRRRLPIWIAPPNLHTVDGAVGLTGEENGLESEPVRWMREDW